jgi:hypothetical protein
MKRKKDEVSHDDDEKENVKKAKVIVNLFHEF